ncbi:LutC/YkgG family protein [Actinoplanes flavus]|uniref:LUD domain-containing protein n=1 Tax=Actinoplanes flavus TaxID=2820290 RepID=A0ABS3URK3_9ACTN|nr:LUD domain-containing protein [Actinoplanes flavus]MBO3741206.1 LUD domain-containing protein [Actinoplanes flavus]
MSTSRELILDRIRAALRDAPVAAEVPRDYRPAGTNTADLDVLIDRLADYKAEVHRVGAGEVAATAARLAGEGGAVLVPPGLPAEWRPEGSFADDGLTPERIAAAGAVLTAAAVAVAETGTIVLDGSPDQGRRVITLLPDVHVCVLRPDQVVASVPDAIARLDPRRPLTWISGPSATSDIELNRVEGVHGPRHLHVLVLDS